MLPPTVKLLTQATAIPVTLAVAIPEPLVTAQICVGAVGWLRTVTSYAPLTVDLKV